MSSPTMMDTSEAENREVVLNNEDSEKLGALLLAITDKLDQLQKSARAKKALLQASGEWVGWVRSYSSCRRSLLVPKGTVS